MLGYSLLLRNGTQHVTRSRDMREVDLSLNLFFTVRGARGRSRRTRCRIRAAAEMFSHQVRFVIFQ
jgi:hypothetical protein